MKRVKNVTFRANDTPAKLFEYWVMQSPFDVPDYCAVKTCLSRVYSAARVGLSENLATAFVVPLCQKHLSCEEEMEVFDYYLVPQE